MFGNIPGHYSAGSQSETRQVAHGAHVRIQLSGLSSHNEGEGAGSMGLVPLRMLESHRMLCCRPSATDPAAGTALLQAPSCLPERTFLFMLLSVCCRCLSTALQGKLQHQLAAFRVYWKYLHLPPRCHNAKSGKASTASPRPRCESRSPKTRNLALRSSSHPLSSPTHVGIYVGT